MPDWVYYQQVKKPWYVAMEEQKDSLMERFTKRQEEEQRQEQEAEIERQVKEQLEGIVSNEFEKLFKDFL